MEHLWSSDLVRDAKVFASKAHSGQVRKYTGEPYMNHPWQVAVLVDSTRGATEEMVAAALLHDVLEDTDTTFDEVYDTFGEIVASLVFWLTDKSKPEDGNRKVRKGLDRAHLACAPAQAQTIKLADLIDNTSSIVERDPNFAKVYLAEKAALLEVLTEGDPILMKMARKNL